MKNKLTIKKYDGDDKYSYAVFYASDVKGMGNIIFFGQAKPIISGLNRYSASHEKKRLEELANNG